MKTKVRKIDRKKAGEAVAGLLRANAGRVAKSGLEFLMLKDKKDFEELSSLFKRATAMVSMVDLIASEVSMASDSEDLAKRIDNLRSGVAAPAGMGTLVDDIMKVLEEDIYE